MTQAQAEETDSKSSKKTLAKISPNQIAADDKDGGKVPQIEDLTSDKAIIEATRLLLRDYGIRKSGAAIRDAIETPHSKVGPKEVVNALSNLGFKASFGSIKINTF